MSYITRTLGPHERILFITGYHWLVWLAAAILTAPAVAIAVGGYPYDALDYAYLALSLGPLSFGLFYFGRAMSTEIAVTSECFIRKSGIVSFETEELELDNIETVSVEQSILGRVLGYGTLAVHGTGQEEIKVSMVNRPVALRRQIQLARERFVEMPELAIAA
jgi:cytochrome c biogenesis factor